MKLLALLLAVTIPTQAFGQELKYLPKWHMKNGEACYNFEETQELLHAESQFRMCDEQVIVYDRMLDDLKLMARELNVALELSKRETKILEANNEKLNQDIAELITRANKAEAGSSPSAGWLVAGGVIVFATGLLVGGYFLARQ